MSLLPALVSTPDLPPPWPLFLFLHGIGERGDGGEALSQVATWGPPRQVEAGHPPPGLLLSPQCPSEQRWQPAALLALLDDAMARHPVDPRRIYLTGLSMGGTGSWDLLAAAAARFAAALIVCGRTDPTQALKLTGLPIKVLHGARDPVIPASDSQHMVEAINAAGGQADLTIYPEAAHVEAWTQAYGEQDGAAWYRWLLSHTR